MSGSMSARWPASALAAPVWQRGDAGWALLVVVATALVYAPVAGHEFVVWDDPGYVTNNARVLQGLSLDNLAWALTSFQMGNWHPLTMLSHMLDVSLFGTWAGGHHLMALGLHALVALLFLVVLRACGLPAWAAGIAALAFAVHPLHVESVAWVSARKDLLSGIFWMLAVAAYLGYGRAPSLARYLQVTLCILLALASKPTAVTLPLVLLLLDLWPLRRWSALPAGAAVGTALLAEKVPWLLLATAAAWLTLRAQAAVGVVSDLDVLPLAQRPGFAAIAYAHFLADSVLPMRLAYLYELRLPVSAGDGAAALLLVLGASAAVLAWRRVPWLAVGWFWFVGVLVPMVGFVHIGLHARADRYMYLPLAGLLLLLAAGLAVLPARWRRVALVATGVWLLGLGLAARDYAVTWKTSEAVYAHALAVEPGHCMARVGVANALVDRGEHAAARRHIESVLAGCEMSRPREMASLLAGKQAHVRGDLDGAERAYRQVLAQWPGSQLAHLRLGALLADRGRYDEAADLLLPVGDAGIGDRQVRARLGEALLRSARHRHEAVAYFRAGIERDAADAAGWFYYAVALEQAGQAAAAVDAYRRSLAIDAGNINARLRLAQALGRMSRFVEARAEVERVLAEHPDNPGAQALLAELASAAGR